jgi:hypothetical protein
VAKLSTKYGDSAKHILIFGPPKSGKTELVGNIASEFELVDFDFENGSDTLLKLPVEYHDNIEVINIPDTRGNPIGIITALHIVKGNPGTVCDAHGMWNCPKCKMSGAPVVEVNLGVKNLKKVYCFDSLTQLTNSAIAHITRGQPDDYKLTYDDWGNLGKLMDTFLSYVQQCPNHIIVISHETEVEMEDGKMKLVPTAGTRNFSRNTAKYFGEVYYCEVKNKKHIVASDTGYSNGILTGSRGGHVLETASGKASLIPILKGEVKNPNPLTQNTPGHAAAGNLAEKLAAMRNK